MPLLPRNLVVRWLKIIKVCGADVKVGLAGCGNLDVKLKRQVKYVQSKERMTTSAIAAQQ